MTNTAGGTAAWEDTVPCDAIAIQTLTVSIDLSLVAGNPGAIAYLKSLLEKGGLGPCSHVVYGDRVQITVGNDYYAPTVTIDQNGLNISGPRSSSLTRIRQVLEEPSQRLGYRLTTDKAAQGLKTRYPGATETVLPDGTRKLTINV